jgi:hypothetical protein
VSDPLLENLILNPVEFTPELPEIDLNDLGLSIAAQGLDYGESSMTVQRVRQAVSEGVTDAYWPSVEATIPIIARGTKDLPIADPLHRLEGWVAEVQQKRSGWIRRDFSLDGGFAGSVGCPVDMAGLTPAQGWSMAHNSFALDIILKVSRYPIWYATVLVESEEFKGSAVRNLEFEIAEMLGTAPGLIDLTIKNEGAKDWRGCRVSLECDSYSSAATAKPSYEAWRLTPKGGAQVKEVAGAKVVKCPPLSPGWVTVLGSEISGVGHMTHADPRRMFFCLEDPSTGLEDVQWRLEYRVLGAASWIQTMEASTPVVVSSPVVGDYQQLDMRECRPERAVTGDQRWEWRLQGRSLSNSGVQPLIRDVYPESTEQWVRVSDTSPPVIDGEPGRPPTKCEDAAGVGTVAWSNPENAKFADGSFAIAENASTIESKTSHHLKVTNFGFTLPAEATILGITVRILRRGSGGIAGGEVVDDELRLIKGGTIEAADRALPSAWPGATTMAIYGGPDDLWDNSWAVADIIASNFGVALSAIIGPPVAGGSKGCKAEVEAISIYVAYVESGNENRTCFASRSIKFTDSGVRRQHPSDEVWGDLVPGGVLLHSPAPGQAGQRMRALIVPSVGDFAARPDAASVKLAAKVAYRPGYLFAREAA